ncbi:MAG TPA: PEP-CTERM sorting domain-containing protein [Bryobacteraceae bacterium]|nr:PEP-CTERM sorting domain-containing protein [Bryobacteraceae bacterium]
MNPKFKFLLAITACACIAGASPVTTSDCVETPVLSPDGIRVCGDSPELTATIYAIPGTTWDAWGNDNPSSQDPSGIETGDGDYNDAHVQIEFSANDWGTLVWTSFASDWANIVGQGTAFVSAASPGPASLGAFTYGEEVVLTLNTPDGNRYWSGDPARNGGFSHWWIQDSPAQSSVPEPGTLPELLIGAGLLGLRALARRVQFRQQL